MGSGCALLPMVMMLGEAVKKASMLTVGGFVVVGVWGVWLGSEVPGMVAVPEVEAAAMAAAAVDRSMVMVVAWFLS